MARIISLLLGLVNFYVKKGATEEGPPLQLILLTFKLEDVSQTEDDTTVATVGAPLVEEVRGVDAAFRNTEVARIGGVIEFRPKLNPLVLTDPGVLEDSQIHVVDAISPKDIAAGATYALGRRNPLEQRGPTCRLDFGDRHAGEWKSRIQVRTNRIADQSVDTGKSTGWVPTIQNRERRATLEGEESVDLPTTEHVSLPTRLVLKPREFVDEVAGQPMRSIVG